MLVSLYVKNLALIDEQEVIFSDGMNILTGETGAGKSILIGSINLALGAKADKDYIRTGCEYALIELCFALNKQQCIQVKELDLPLENENELLLQRKIMPGRSNCRVNGESVSTQQLKVLSSILLDMYGQHEHQSLLKPAAGKKMLDEYAGEDTKLLKQQLKLLITKYKELKEELENQNTDEAARVREQQLLEFEINEILSAELVENEDEQLEKKYRKLVNAKRIKEAVFGIHALTGYEEDGCAGETIGRALRELKSLSGLDEDLESLVSQLQDVDDLLNDFNRSMAQYRQELEFDGEEFEQTEERLNVLNHLKSKYGHSISEIIVLLDEKQDKLDKLNHYETYFKNLTDQIAKQKKAILDLCERISTLRKKAAEPLAEKLKTAMIDLNFLDVAFDIAITSDREAFTPDGYDEVEFLISTNPGETMRPLRQIASGGELSRIMLAFKTVFADKDETNTLVFDEIDTGISGKTAWKVSEKLGRLASNHQIICITHLAQIASMADTHFLIEKQVKQERTCTNIRKLNDNESLEELARLLGSGTLTEAVLNNAKEMKETAKKSKIYQK